MKSGLTRVKKLSLLVKKIKYVISQNTTSVIVGNYSIIKIFLVVHVELRISPRSLEKIWNGPNGILKVLGETDS
jgi:hypothetical protein